MTRKKILSELEIVNADIQMLEKFKGRSNYLEASLRVSKNRQKYLLNELQKKEKRL